MSEDKKSVGVIRTRFAPSPTGSMHIGNLRTALYAYALSKHSGGDFILRIEDTDKKREVEGGVEEIKRLLKIFGFTWDEYFIQSERVKDGIYKKAAEKLVSDGHAFYCQCKGKNAKTEGFSKVLRDPCRDKGLTSGAIKLKVPEGESISFTDFVLEKEISWNTSDVLDATLLKSDGYPTYHLAVVTDDTDMNITHALRGHDWMPSTPIHLLVYKYLGYKVPEIGHLTDIMDPEGGKLSKRKGSTSCEGLIKEGYLPEAILNFIMLLGWAPKDNRELFTLDQFVENFDHSGFQKSNPVFNKEKLDWFNGEYVRLTSDDELSKLILPFAPEGADEDIVKKITPVIKDRIVKLSDVKVFAGFFFERKNVDKGLLGPKYRLHLEKAKEVISGLSDWKLEKLNNALMGMVGDSGFKTGEFFMDLRIAITGSKFTPPINDSMIILGRDESLERLEEVLK
jgi:glutamyl-tRNA synthetase